MIGGETCGELRSIKISMGWADSGLFNEKYRVVAVEAERLTVKGIGHQIVHLDPGKVALDAVCEGSLQ